jgi:hypothetical protein
VYHCRVAISLDFYPYFNENSASTTFPDHLQPELMSQLTIPTRENLPATSDVTLLLSSFASTADDPGDTNSIFRAPKAADQPTQQTVTTRGSKRGQYKA